MLHTCSESIASPSLPVKTSSLLELGPDSSLDASLPLRFGILLGDHKAALGLFSRAIELGPPADELHIFHSNRSLCALSVGDYKLATADGEKCVELKPDWSKGYSRLGSAHFYAGRFGEAATAYAKGLAADPTNDSLLKGLQVAAR